MKSTITPAGHERMLRDRVDNDRYDEFRSEVNRHAAEQMLAHGAALYTTDVDPDRLWAAYLDAAPDGARQSRNCRTCERFIKKYGGLVVISANGVAKPALWTAIRYDVPPSYRAANEQLLRMVDAAKVTGAFTKSGAPSLGVDRDKDGWTHFFVDLPYAHKSVVESADQWMARKREEREMLYRGLTEFKPSTFEKAVALLSGGALARSEKHLALARWLVGVRTRFVEAPEYYYRDNILWDAARHAPDGWCHVRSGMIGTLLEDIEAGKSPDEIKSAWDAKMDPLAYMRPQAAPSAGNVKQAEDLVRKMGIEASLKRRFARLEDLDLLWHTPVIVSKRTANRAAADGVFSHLLHSPDGPNPKGKLTGVVKMTFVKFASKVLPTAEQIEVFAPAQGNYVTFMTAADPSAPGILQWGNNVSWFVYSNGSPPSRFNLRATTWCPVDGVTINPSMWNKPLDSEGRHGNFAAFIIRGAYHRESAGLCLFPEILKSELHSVRSTIEAHSKKTMVLPDQHGAVGLGIGKSLGGFEPLRVNVTVAGVVTPYEIDRWD